MNHQQESRVNHFLDKLLWGLLAGAVMYGSSSLSDMSKSVSQLSERMAVIVEKVGNHDKRIEHIEERIMQ